MGEKDLQRTRPRTRTLDHWAINTTVRCQHRCIYCFEGKREKMRNVPAEETRRLIEQAAGQVQMIIFMGAEPTLNPDIVELTRHGAGLGLKVCYSTNALRFASMEFLSACLDAGLWGLELSFHYPDDKIYSSITRSRPAGFLRLLRAMENIEQANSGPTSGLGVNVNIVVSRFNLWRLAEVIGHVTSRFCRTPHYFTIKRLMLLPGDEGQEHEKGHVPLRTLRDALRAQSRTLLAVDSLMFRGFPLCAIPEMEHLDGDLCYWLDEVKVGHNFFSQDRIADMFPDDLQRERHRSSWLCEICALDPFCLSRQIFVHGPPALESQPLPLVGPLPDRVAELARGSARGEEAIRSFGSRSSAEDRPAVRLLRRLWRVSPPGIRLPGLLATWHPLDEGHILIESGEEKHEILLGIPGDDWPAFGIVGPFAVRMQQPHLPQGLLAAEPVIQTLLAMAGPSFSPAPGPTGDPRALLPGDCAEVIGAACAPGSAPGPRALPAVCFARWREGRLQAVEALLDLPGPAKAGQVRIRLAPGPQERVVVSFVEGWACPDAERSLVALLGRLGPWATTPDSLLAGRVVSRLCSLVDSSPAFTTLDSSRVLAGLSDAIILRLPGGDQLGSCRLREIDSSRTEGFLCAAGILQPDLHLLGSPEGSLWIAAIAGALDPKPQEGARAREAAPDVLPPFFREVWRTFGETLLPRAGSRAALTGGVVSGDGLVLKLVCGQGREMEICIEPARGHASHVAAARGLGLSFRTHDGAPVDAAMKQVLAGYARRLRRSR